jgi:hypothetical protein
MYKGFVEQYSTPTMVESGGKLTSIAPERKKSDELARKSSRKIWNV